MSRTSEYRFLRAMLAAGALAIFVMPGSATPAAAQGIEGAPAALTPADPIPQLREYKLGPGDRLRIAVFGHEDLSGVFEVDGTGAVAFPLVGTIRVGGMTLSQVEAAVVGALQPDYLKNPRVSAEVLNYRPFYIMGEVREPGSYPYVNGITVLNAVAIAGGFSYRARESRMSIIRADDANREAVPVTPDTIVLPGDIIEVPERFF